jgi:hypothetical protein
VTTKWCLHCKRRLACKPRGLCKEDYNDLAVRHRYPVAECRRESDQRWKCCRHCGSTRSVREKGLCWVCRNGSKRKRTPSVLHLYESTSRYTYRQDADCNAQSREPEPTDTLPGSAERIAVMAERVRLGQSTTSKLDKGFGDG